MGRKKKSQQENNAAAGAAAAKKQAAGKPAKKKAPAKKNQLIGPVAPRLLPEKRFTHEERAERRKKIAQAFIDGGRLRELFPKIAAEFGVSKALVEKVVYEEEKIAVVRRDGKNLSDSRVTHEKVLKILALFRDGKSPADIGREMNVSRQRIGVVIDKARELGVLTSEQIDRIIARREREIFEDKTKRRLAEEKEREERRARRADELRKNSKAVVAELRKGGDPQEIAKRLGIMPGTVYAIARRNGVELPGRVVDMHSRMKCLRDLLDGVGLAETARKRKVSMSAVRRVYEAAVAAKIIQRRSASDDDFNGGGGGGGVSKRGRKAD